MIDKLEILKKKILYRASYRGTKEMDILLRTFVKKHINNFSFDQLKELETFLEFEDEILLNFYNHDISNNKILNNKISKIFKNFKM